MFFTFGAEKKAAKALNYAEEKLAEAKAMAEKNKTEPLERANQKYQGYLNLANQKTQEAKEQGKDVEELAVLLTEVTLKHQDVLVRVFEQIPEEAKAGIKKAIEISSKGSEQAVEAVEGPEKKEELLLKMQEMKMRMEYQILELEERLKAAEERIKELEEKLRKEAPFSVALKPTEVPAIGVPPEPPKKCIGEGETGSIFGYDICCPGLTKIANSWSTDNECIAPTDGSFICSYCGNGVCGKGENVCNCPQDCKIVKNLPPVIDDLQAPSQLRVKEEGIWTIRAHDPEGGPLTYSVDWGEYLPIVKEMAPPEKIIQTATFSHTYTRAGTYTIRFTVTDDHQQKAETSVTVVVIPEEVEKFIKVISPNGGESWQEGNTYKILWNSKGVKAVDIVYNRAKGWTVVTNYPAEKGEYLWTPVGIVKQYEGFVGKDLSKVDLKISIFDSENLSIFDESDDYFSIVESGVVASTVSIPDATVYSGKTVTLPISIAGVTKLGAATIWLSYDKDVVTVDSVADGNMGTVIYAIYNDEGVTKMTWFDPYGKTGDYIFANVTLRAATAVDLSYILDLNVKEFVDTSFVPITPTVIDGTFKVE